MTEEQGSTVTVETETETTPPVVGQDRLKSWSWFGTGAADWVGVRVPEVLGKVTFIPKRTISDSTYLRASLGNLWLALPVVAFVFGILSAHTTGGVAIPPSTTQFLILMAIGIIDAFSGLIGFLPFFVWTILTGHLDSLHAIGGTFGLAMMWWAGAQTGHYFRPVGRWDNEPSSWQRVWRIGGDMIILPAIGGLILGSLVLVMPWMTGLQVPIANQSGLCKIVAVSTFFVRAVAQALVIYNFRDRLASLPWPVFEPRNKIVDLAIKVLGVFIAFVAIWCMFGWTLPTLLIVIVYVLMGPIILIGEKFPESTWIWRLTPRHANQLMVIILVAELLLRLVSPHIMDPQMALAWTFVGLGLLVLALVALMQFKGKDWPETWILRILGALSIVLFVLVAQGFITLS
jgi:hypothetical protein